MKTLTLFDGASNKISFTELGRFVLVGAVASATHLGILYILTEFSPLWYLPSAVIGFGFGFLVSFILQKHWTFNASSSRGTKRQLIQYFLWQVSSLALNTAGLVMLVEFFGMWYLHAQVFLLGVLALSTFFLSKYVIFAFREDTGFISRT